MEVFLLGIVLAMVLAFLFINGWTDAPNSIATVVVIGKVPVKVAVPSAALLHIVGAFFGSAVAATVLDGMVVKELLTLKTIAAGLASVIFWGWLAARNGWPISKSHSLLAGIAGAGFAGGVAQAYKAYGPTLPELFWGGWGALLPKGWIKVAWGMPISLFVGFGIAFALGAVVIVLFSGRKWMEPVLSVVHKLAAVAASLGHSMNDTQKSIGICTLVLYTGGMISGTAIPWWVIVICAVTMGLGTACGGWRIMETLGKKLGPVAEWQAAVAMTTASCIVIGTSLAGVPLSTTHTTTAALAGAIGSRNLGDVKKDIAIRIVKGWVLTFPVCFTLSSVAALLTECAAALAPHLF